jgi:1-acyl-sn-glycerol-3-phosphate acyltransferase
VGALYTTGSALFLSGFRALGVDLRSIGHEHIPTTGPAVLASNHIGYLDFAFVALAPPAPRREVRFLARHEFFEHPVGGPLLRALGQIPVDVHGDPMRAAEVAGEALGRGEIVGVHPEGTISPSFVPRRAKSGAVRLADAAGVPIVHVALWGTQRLLTKGRPARPQRGVVVTVRYGEPFVPTGRTTMARSRQLMDRIGELVALSQRSYPQRAVPGDDWWVPAHLGGSAPTAEEAEERLREQDAARRAARQGAGGSAPDAP